MVRLGVSADVSFLYSVYQNADEAHTTMVFRGVASDLQDEWTLGDGTLLRLFTETEEPWRLVRGKSPPEVIRRFFYERAHSRFGIYWDTHDGGPHRLAAEFALALVQARVEPETPSETEDM